MLSLKIRRGSGPERDGQLQLSLILRACEHIGKQIKLIQIGKARKVSVSGFGFHSGLHLHIG